MLSALALSFALVPTGDPTGPRKYPTVYVPAEAPFGYLYQPAVDLHPIARFPAATYEPKPGDVLLLSDTNLFWTVLYRIALTGKPGHSAVVVRMADGRLGAFEAGYNDTIWMRLTPLDYRLNEYHGTIWIRPRLEPLTPEQDRRLTEFAEVARDRRYALGRFAIQLTPLRSRGPFCTFVSGRPRGIGYRYHCAEALIECFCMPDLSTLELLGRPPPTRRISFTTARGMSISTGIRRSRADGARRNSGRPWSAAHGPGRIGRDRPQPGPGSGLTWSTHSRPLRQQAPAPVIVGYVPGELRPIALPEQSPQRVGLFDRPPRLFRRH